ncbi:hypothetical protein OKW32_000631 [Paraburkholderia youngii]
MERAWSYAVVDRRCQRPHEVPDLRGRDTRKFSKGDKSSPFQQDSCSEESRRQEGSNKKAGGAIRRRRGIPQHRCGKSTSETGSGALSAILWRRRASNGSAKSTAAAANVAPQTAAIVSAPAQIYVGDPRGCGIYLRSPALFFHSAAVPPIGRRASLRPYPLQLLRDERFATFAMANAVVELTTRWVGVEMCWASLTKGLVMPGSEGRNGSCLENVLCTFVKG